MGWLRDLMQIAGVPSYGVLARSALAHQSWPSGTRAQQRSLATMLSRFDRGIELDWLADRPAIQQVLSELLGCTVADLRGPLLRVPEGLSAAQRLKFEALPLSRAFDFLEEELPPGIPNVLAMPTTWTRLLWTVRPGDGASLTGQWLDCRGRAEVKRLRKGERFVDLPCLGPPLYVELTGGPIGDPTQWKPDRPTCLVIDAHKFNAGSWSESGWLILSSPPVASVLDSIVFWVAQRMSSQTKFNIEAITRWFRDYLVNEGLAETLGDVLGWCGYVAEFGLEPSRRRTSKQILSEMFKRFLEPLAKGRETSPSTWTRKVPELLVSMAERSLLLPNTDLMAPRSLEAWIDLMPEEERVGPDLDWMKSHLTSASKVIRPRDLDKAAAQFPPGAHRWLGLLRDAGLLRPISDQDYVLRPHCLARLCLHVANNALIQGSSAVWGAALFGEQPRASVWSQLRRQADSNPESLVDSVLEELDEESAGSVLALEAAVIVIGMSILCGREVPSNIRGQLLDESCALSLQEESVPSLRIGIGSTDGVDSNTLWWLSLIALSENTTGSRAGRESCIDPWNQNAPPAALGRLLDKLFEQLQRQPLPRPSWVLGAFQTLERLRQAIGVVVGKGGAPHPILAPGIVLDEVQHGVLEWESLCPIVENELLYEVFRAMAERANVAVSLWAGSFWRTFGESRFAPAAMVFVRKHIGQLGPHVPESMGVAWLNGTEPVPCDDVLGVLPPSVVSSWLNKRDIGDVPLPVLVVRSVPEDLLDEMLADLDARDESLLPIFWARVPIRVVTRIQRFRVIEPAKAARWVDGAPVAQSAALFKAAALDDWLKASQPLLLALRRFCVRCIKERSDDWQLAYSWLVRIERVLRD
jgi:hypothetical protein